jgi:hypothetical protein
MRETTNTFYRVMALLFIAIALVGFAPTFYLRGYLSPRQDSHHSHRCLPRTVPSPPCG